MSFQQVRDQTGLIPISGQTGNLLLGTTLQVAAVPSMLRITATAPAANPGDGRMDVFAGGRQLTGRQGQVVPCETFVGRGPDAQLGWLLEAPVAAGELLELVFRNTDGAATIAAPGIGFWATLDPL